MCPTQVAAIDKVARTATIAPCISMEARQQASSGSSSIGQRFVVRLDALVPLQYGQTSGDHGAEGSAHGAYGSSDGSGSSSGSDYDDDDDGDDDDDDDLALALGRRVDHGGGDGAEVAAEEAEEEAGAHAGLGGEMDMMAHAR